ncbi:sugar-binding protein [Pullulanibacillus sp. KACC 23026]|uniref:sugar-binding protein n=1 Tax=Pullulanibacillus sp. KACC 23026 TaxID=3028315 RepID=UPI0023AED9ED|nr:sugar-binding protein [Pullulanibacillus sp. KACC 23026]WEG14750.1 sugar-binding protein [Pullulanibacillus sp. KACC 23026]
MKVRGLIYAFLIVGFLASASLGLHFFLKALHYKTVLTNNSGTKPKAYHLVLIPEEVRNPYWQMVKKGADEAGKENNAVVEYTGPIQTSISEHIRFIDEAISSKVDGIITQGLNPDQMTSVINKAVEQGIPVITIDTDAPKSKRSAYVGTDNYEAGEKAGEALAEATKGRANVAIIIGSKVSANQQERVSGFKNALKNYPHIKIVAIESSNISRIQAAEKTFDIYQDHPDVNAFFGTSALDGLGIASVTSSDPQTKPFIIGFDDLPDTLKDIKEGKIDETVAQEPYLMGYQSVELMIKLLQGKPIPTINYTDTTILDSSNLPPTNSGSEVGGTP